MAMTFGIHIGHMGGPLPEMRKLWKFADEMGFSRAEVAELAKNGLHASLLPPERISALSSEIDTAVRQGAIA